MDEQKKEKVMKPYFLFLKGEFIKDTRWKDTNNLLFGHYGDGNGGFEHV